MPTSTEIKQLFGGLRPALKQGRAELQAAASSLRGMIATLDALDPINGDILAAVDDAELAAALAAARPRVNDVAGYTRTETRATVDAQGHPVLDENGAPVTVEVEVEVEVVGFLDNAAALCGRIQGMDTPELRAGIAAAKAATEGGE
jgi:hypothetical protein